MFSTMFHSWQTQPSSFEVLITTPANEQPTSTSLPNPFCDKVQSMWISKYRKIWKWISEVNQSISEWNKNLDSAGTTEYRCSDCHRFDLEFSFCWFKCQTFKYLNQLNSAKRRIRCVRMYDSCNWFLLSRISYKVFSQHTFAGKVSWVNPSRWIAFSI